MGFGGMSLMVVGTFSWGVAAIGDYGTWTHSADIQFDTSPTGANVANEVDSFPLLLRLNGSNFNFSQARGRGEDLRFTKTDGSIIPYQIDRWDSAKGQAEVWVLADTVRGNLAGQAFRMYWGNATAADSSSGPNVFASNYVAAWHLSNPTTGTRLNSAPGGIVATPAQYTGNESTPGMIGLADSLDGAATGKYLNVGAGYNNLTNGFTFSVWAYPTAVKNWSHILDLGNGQASDNILFARVGTTDSAGLDNYNGSAMGTVVHAANGYTLNQWQHLAVTVNGLAVKIYRNGAVIGSGNLAVGISGATRNQCYLGRSNWAADEFYQGKLDEPEISRVARSDNWIKLSYENQKSGSTVVKVKLLISCLAKFSPPSDTSVSEHTRLVLKSVADCASAVIWEAVFGPAPVILDPETRDLSIALPRYATDTTLVYRFTATYPDSSPTRSVKVSVKHVIPNPAFTLPAATTWSGNDTLTLRPTITNLAAVKASPDSVLHWSWTLSGVAADSIWVDGGLRLAKAGGDGNLTVTLCLDNGGATVCSVTAVTVSAVSGLAARARYSGEGVAEKPGHDAQGRRLPAQGGRFGKGPPPVAIFR